MAFEEFTSQGKVNAEQIEEARSVITPQGAVTGQAGQWEVRYPDGDVRVLDDDAFQAEWGGGSGDSEEETPTEQRTGDPLAEKSLSTRQRAGAVSSTGDSEPTTDDVDSESDSSQDSDKDSDSEETPKPARPKSRAKDEDNEPPV